MAPPSTRSAQGPKNDTSSRSTSSRKHSLPTPSLPKHGTAPTSKDHRKSEQSSTHRKTDSATSISKPARISLTASVPSLPVYRESAGISPEKVESDVEEEEEQEEYEEDSSPPPTSGTNSLLKTFVFPEKATEKLPHSRNEPSKSAEIDDSYTSCPNPSSVRRGSETSAVPDELVCLHIVVVGGDGVGKSTFTKSIAQDRGGSSRSAKVAKYKLDNTVFALYFIEVGISDIEYQNEEVNELEKEEVKWPQVVQNLEVDSPDAVIVLYDVKNPSSLVGVPKLLRTLYAMNIATALITAKCAGPIWEQMVDAKEIRMKAKCAHPDIHLFDWQLDEDEAPDKCISALLAEYRRHQMALADEFPPLTKSVTLPDRLPNDDISLESPAGAVKLQVETSGAAISSPVEKQLTPETTDSGELEDNDVLVGATIESVTPTAPLSPMHTRKPSSPSSFLHLDKLPERHENLRTQITPSTGHTRTPSFGEELNGTFDELVNRLLAAGLNKPKKRFIESFLMVYRLFAAPSQLLAAIIARSNDLICFKGKDPAWRVKLKRHMKIINKWLGYYPGDFAHPSTKSQLETFVRRVKNIPEMPAQTEPITLRLETVMDTDDTKWACSDVQDVRRSRAETFLSTSSLDSDEETLRPSMSTLGRSSSAKATIRSSLDAKMIFGGQKAKTTTLNAIGPDCAIVETDVPISEVIDIAESAQREASLLNPDPKHVFTKQHWRDLMAIHEEDIARELTRIDWIMFCSIRARDIIRYATLNSDHRLKFPDLSNVSRMVQHFNHLVAWSTYVILFRDKPKHRAVALEKLMKVARQCWKMNNYNSLGALVASIVSIPVDRLGATKAEVDRRVLSDFLKMDILMKPEKGHFRYRIAWDTGTKERVPYLAVHLSDLMKQNQCSKTYISTVVDSKTPTPTASKSPSPATSPGEDAPSDDENEDSDDSMNMEKQQLTNNEPKKKEQVINWKKFSAMADVLHTVQLAKSTPYTGFAANEQVRALVLDMIFSTDDDEMYDRSVLVEPEGAAFVPGEGVRKKIAEKLRR